MLLTYPDLLDLIAAGVIEHADRGRVNGASLDVTLGDILYIEDYHSARPIDLLAKQAPAMRRLPLTLDEHGPRWLLKPADFVLAATREIFHLPADIALEYKLKSSLARAGLGHLLAGWGDPGWHGSALTLELVNHLQAHDLILRPGMPIGQVVFWRGSQPVPAHASYATRGQYNRDAAATPSKGLR